MMSHAAHDLPRSAVRRLHVEKQPCPSGPGMTRALHLSPSINSCAAVHVRPRVLHKARPRTATRHFQCQVFDLRRGPQHERSPDTNPLPLPRRRAGRSRPSVCLSQLLGDLTAYPCSGPCSQIGVAWLARAEQHGTRSTTPPTRRTHAPSIRTILSISPSRPLRPRWPTMVPTSRSRTIHASSRHALSFRTTPARIAKVRQTRKAANCLDHRYVPAHL